MGECRVHRFQEWFFKRPSPLLWGSLSSRLGVVPNADSVDAESSPFSGDHKCTIMCYLSEYFRYLFRYLYIYGIFAVAERFLGIVEVF